MAMSTQTERTGAYKGYRDVYFSLWKRQDYGLNWKIVHKRWLDLHYKMPFPLQKREAWTTRSFFPSFFQYGSILPHRPQRQTANTRKDEPRSVGLDMPRDSSVINWLIVQTDMITDAERSTVREMQTRDWFNAYSAFFKARKGGSILIENPNFLIAILKRVVN